jgi:acyl-coenzyme A thioesterase PaaI-like protein
MTDQEISARLLAAMSDRAPEAELASVTIDMLKPGAIASVEATPIRRTRTLLFMSTEAFNAAGERIASANAVYKLRV